MPSHGRLHPLAPVIRDASDDDAPGIIALIAACWAEYPGCVMDLDGEVPELRALATYYSVKGGRVWVAEIAGTIVGVVGIKPLSAEAWEIGKMYVAGDRRGTGLAQNLLTVAEAAAVAKQATQLCLWSDQRFERAHRFYAKCGYFRTGESRALDDLSNTVELRFEK